MKLLTLSPEPQLRLYTKQKTTSSKTQSCPSVCRCCQFYQFQGRGSGYCQKLGVAVGSCWNACSLALPPFEPSWEKCSLEGCHSHFGD